MTDTGWIEEWLDGVVSGRSTMSQRAVSTIEKRGGSLAAIQRAAVKRGVHLLLLTDDRGKQLIAASMEKFKVLC